MRDRGRCSGRRNKKQQTLKKRKEQTQHKGENKGYREEERGRKDKGSEARATKDITRKRKEGETGSAKGRKESSFKKMLKAGT